MNTKTFAMISLGMGCFFIFAAIMMFVKPPTALLEWGWTRPQTSMLGGMILIYGAFRFWRAYRMLKEFR